jgi:hypothetical protein
MKEEDRSTFSMRIFPAAAYALGIAAAVAMLSGCSSGSQSALAPVTTLTNANRQIAVGYQDPKIQKEVAEKLHAWAKLHPPVKLSLKAEQLLDSALHRTHRKMPTSYRSIKRLGTFINPKVTSSDQLIYVSDPGCPGSFYLHEFPITETCVETTTGEGGASGSPPIPSAVYIYAWSVPGFPIGTFLGQLGGSQCYGPSYGFADCAPPYEALGNCVDKNQDVYVADGLAQGVWEYAHDQIVPINFLSDPGNVPWSCSVDPTTGNVAVSNYETITGGSGSVYVYPGGSANWTPYYNIGLYPMYQDWFIGYDNKGNLFNDGPCPLLPTSLCLIPDSPSGSYYYIEVNELKKGASYFSTLTMIGVPLTTIQYPGQIQWDNIRYIDVGDRQTSAGNSPASCIDETTLGCGAMYGTTVVGTELKQHTVTNFIDTPLSYGTWTIGKAGVVVVPNPISAVTSFGFYPSGCVFYTSPFETCTQVYYYGLGVSPIYEFDQPDYQFEPAFATLSK